MSTVPRSVLHVLPHPGGGGETYFDALERMGGYRFDRRSITSGPTVRRADRILPAAFGISRDARAYDLVHVQGEVGALLCLPALAMRPSLLTPNGLNLLRRTSGLQERAARLNLRTIVRAADRTICVSEAERDELVEIVGSSLAGRLVVIHNGVPFGYDVAPDARRDVRASLGIGESAVVAVCAGDLEPLKDPFTAARAALSVAPELDLVMCFAGDGTLRADLDRLATGEGGRALRVLGRRNDMERVYAAADIVVLASIREGLPFAVLEGMARGLAPIVSAVPGSMEAVGDAGIVVGCGDVPGFAAALGRLAADEVERRARGAAARERVARMFTASLMIERTRMLYDELTAARVDRRPGKVS